MTHFFTVLPNKARVPAIGKSQAFLLTDNWDDWFKYSTQYVLVVFDGNGEKHVAGLVKIGQHGMQSGQSRPALPETFDSLGEEYFSLGQEESYYIVLNELGPDVRDRTLRGLSDIALDQGRFIRALNEKVTGVSLLRSVTRSTVRGQFARLARGGVRSLSHYEFTYTAPAAPRAKDRPLTLSFEVVPNSMPPTNIHVLVGRNGVGKTHLLHHMSRSLVEGRSSSSELGAFEGTVQGEEDDDEWEQHVDLQDGEESTLFANLVSVTFSAFDDFDPLPNRQDRSEGLPCAYVGLKRSRRSGEEAVLAPKTPSRLSREFGDSVHLCSQGDRLIRWRRALEMLEADPLFSHIDVASLADVPRDEIKAAARKIFAGLSSGHKIVLLTITRLVETVEERTLVLIDEPEAHLHPPLLSAFVRALSDLLVNRNGVAIIATHSPVVVQEVPAQCVWKIRRSGRKVDVDRPEIETFGESIGVLTREIFGLEVTHTGFNQMLREAVDADSSFQEVLDKFSGDLGGEGRALIRALMANRGELDD